MKAPPMSFKQVLARLESLGSENVRKMFARHGAGENQFGVKLGDLRALAKKLKTNHALALQLWATGNADARILATMLMSPAKLSSKDIEAMMNPLTYFRLVDELVENAIVNSPHADALRVRWMESPKEMTSRAGWRLLAARITSGNIAGLDLDAMLRQIEAEILSAPRRKQEVMNMCLVMTGVHVPAYTRKCIALGEKLGRFDPTPVPKGCVASYAPEWIAAALARKK